MEEWHKEWFKICEAFTYEVEQFLGEVEEEVGEWVEAIAEISVDISDMAEELLFSDLEAYLNEWLEPIIELHLDLPEDDPFYNPGREYIPDPRENQHPACVGCQHYHGQAYGGTMFVCAMHPYGWDDSSCPDWEG